MHISYQALEGELNKRRGELASFYIIVGSERILVRDAREAIYDRAQGLGYQCRRLSVEADKDWEQVRHAWLNRGLYPGNRLLELSIADVKKIKRGVSLDFMKQLKPLPGATLLLVLPWLKPNEQRAAWLKKLQALSVQITIKPITYGGLARFIKERIRHYGLNIHPDGVGLLEQNYEGNTEALDQDLHKLSLLHASEHVTAEQVKQLSANHSRFGIFAGLEAALQGEPERVMQIMDFVELQKSPPQVLLVTCARDLRCIRQLSACRDSRERAAVLNRSEVPAFRHRLVEQASYRLNLEQVDALLRLCQQLDRSNKGALAVRPYHLLRMLLLGLAGLPTWRGFERVA